MTPRSCVAFAPTNRQEEFHSLPTASGSSSYRMKATWRGRDQRSVVVPGQPPVDICELRTDRSL